MSITITLPNVGGDNNTWGTELNTALTTLLNAINQNITDIAALQAAQVTQDAAHIAPILASLGVKRTLLANSDGTWPNRYNYTFIVEFRGPNAPTIRTDGVTTGLTNQAVDTLDEWEHSA